MIENQLAAELGKLELFCELLTREQAILEKGEADKLLPIVEDKTVLAADLSKLLAQREQTLQQAGLSIGSEGMESWLASHSHSAPLRQQWLRLLELAAHARRQQDMNGKLIALQLQHNQQALAALMSASGKPLTYGPDGQQRVGGGGRTLGSA